MPKHLRVPGPSSLLGADLAYVNIVSMPWTNLIVRAVSAKRGLRSCVLTRSWSIPAMLQPHPCSWATTVRLLKTLCANGRELSCPLNKTTSGNGNPLGFFKL